MTDLAQASTDSVTKKVRGAKKNPNSGISKTYEIMKNMTPAERTRANVLKLTGPTSEVGLKEQVASVYYYNTLKKLALEAAETGTTTA